MVVIIPVSGAGSEIFNILNDVIVIALASIASYYISKQVAKTSVKSIISSFSVNDMLNLVKQIINKASNDEELKSSVNVFISNMAKSILSNPDLKKFAKDVIKSIMEDPDIRSEAKKVLSDTVEQYPVLARLLGVNNARKEKDT